MGIFIMPLILLMSGPFAPLLLINAVFPGEPGEFTYELGSFAIDVMDFFWITIPEFLGIPLF